MDLARLRGVKYLTWEDSEKVHQEDEVSGCFHLCLFMKFTIFDMVF